MRAVYRMFCKFSSQCITGLVVKSVRFPYEMTYILKFDDITNIA